MKPPRYKLREFMIDAILRKISPGRFLEIGYGEGDFLLTLSKRGFFGSGIDTSTSARAHCEELLSTHRIDQISLVDEFPSVQNEFDYVFFFEVFGYWDDPRKEIESIVRLLKPGGKLLFSFTNIANAGAAEELTGNMRSFSRSEITAMLGTLDLNIEYFWNYGYPLSNMLRPLLNQYHRSISKSSPATVNPIAESGRRPQGLLISCVSAIANIFIVRPCSWLQLFFKDSDMGTGFLVFANKPLTK